MKCNILKYLLIVACISCGFNLYGQGLVTRPTNPGKPNKPEKSAPQAIVCEPNGYINGKGRNMIQTVKRQTKKEWRIKIK